MKNKGVTKVKYFCHTLIFLVCVFPNPLFVDYVGYEYCGHNKDCQDDEHPVGAFLHHFPAAYGPEVLFAEQVSSVFLFFSVLFVRRVCHFVLCFISC